MKIDVDKKILDLNGKIIKQNNEIVTFKTLAILALTSVEQSRSVNGKEKFERYMLAQRISKGGKVDLSVEEVAKLKELVGNQFPPLFVGRFYEALD